jgi:hypothetical protein
MEAGSDESSVGAEHPKDRSPEHIDHVVHIIDSVSRSLDLVQGILDFGQQLAVWVPKVES